MAKDPYRYFRIEARELLDGLTQGILELERGEGGSERIAGLLRLAHTLKGASRVVKQPAIAELAHSMESVLAPHRNGDSPLSGHNVGELLRLADGIASNLATLESAPQPRAAARPPVLDALETVRVEVDEVDAILDNLSEGSIRLSSIRQQVNAIGRARRLADLVIDQVTSGVSESGSVFVPKVRALAEDLSTSLERIDRGMTDNIAQAEREYSQARERADQLRLLPAKFIFPALERATQETAQSLGKRVEFKPIGGDIRLDAHVLPILRDALLHLVSNAVAHGIEGEPVRVAAGKPATGRVELRVERHGTRVTFVCHDDGGGINIEAVRRAATAHGIISPAEDRTLKPDEVIQLILRGGLSTTSAVTEVSGRGVGLDVVRAAAARLKGDVKIESLPKVGTTIQIRVPVSLTSVPALMVEASDMTVCIPLDSVRHTLMVADQDIVHTGVKSAIAFEGRLIPFLVLSRALQLPDGSGGPAPRRPAVVVAAGPDMAAVAVDRLAGLETVLLRRLPPIAAIDPIVAGASLDGSGTPRLVLDPGGVVKAPVDRPISSPVANGAARRPILVVDDSLTTRMLEQSILESAGHQVELAASAEEAMEKAASRRYALFLVDVEMPGMDGFEFVSRTRADPVLREVPAILVTSRNSIEDRRRGEESGASAYIVKSEFDQGFLLQTIRQLVDRP